MMIKQSFIALLLTLAGFFAFAQDRMVLTGKVLDSKTQEPLSYATIGVKGHVDETFTNSFGNFTFHIPISYLNDTLTVRYIGYHGFEKKISELQSVEMVYLEEAYTLLKEVVVAHRKLSLRDIDKSVRVIRGNLYAMETEVTNGDFNLFLDYLEDYNQTDTRAKCDYILDGYSDSEKEFFRRYTGELMPLPDSDTLNKSTAIVGPRMRVVKDYGEYPAVNVSFEAAVRYCEWLTDQYNSGKKKRFKKVKFRLPTLDEWQIAALGYARFQSWKLTENQVEVVIPEKDSVIELSRGKKKVVPVDKDILYPWYGAYNYRKKPSNHFHCYLGNFRVESVHKPCPANARAFDGFIAMGFCGAYFPNNMGLYDVVGNVAEMIDDKGKACGGSWNDWPSESTIHSVKNYSRPDATIGFRVFMEVVEN
jgi:hypothetical protein